MMKMIFVVTALLMGTTAFAMAQSNTGGGASSMSPGHEMQSPSGSSSSTGKGASEYSPGDRMQDKKGSVGESRGSTKGASEYSPGDRMHDKSTKDKY
jgi:hypothetical protein